MAVKIGSARIDERGMAKGGKAGDQTGKEVSTQNWYLHAKGWVVLRAKRAAVAEAVAVAMERACANPCIGYDQSQNQTLWDEAQKYGFDPGAVKKAVETDCARLVRVCCAFAGVMARDFYTGSQVSRLMETGEFEKLTSSKYTDSSAYLKRGDILVTRTKGHTVVVLTDGPKAKADKPSPIYALGDRILRNGDDGEDVKQLQETLMELGYDLGKWGADGEYGDCTELAVETFQRRHNCRVDGEVGPETIAALDAALDALTEPDKPANVRIEGGQCYIRTAPGGQKLGVAARGTIWAYAGEVSADGWLKIYTDDAHAKSGWVSGKYGKVEA